MNKQAFLEGYTAKEAKCARGEKKKDAKKEEKPKKDEK